MQDNAQQEQEQQAQQDEMYFPVLRVGLDDLEEAIAPDAEAADEDDYCTEQERAEQQKQLDFVRNMSPVQWHHLADYMGGILFDCDRWDDALQAALAREMSYEGVAPDHQAMQEAARS